MKTTESQKSRDLNREYRLRIKNIRVLTFGKIRIPREVFGTQEELEEELRKRKYPACYESYLKIEKKKHPKIYNGNYASTINSFSMGFRAEQCR